MPTLLSLRARFPSLKDAIDKRIPNTKVMRVEPQITTEFRAQRVVLPGRTVRAADAHCQNQQLADVMVEAMKDGYNLLADYIKSKKPPTHDVILVLPGQEDPLDAHSVTFEWKGPQTDEYELYLFVDFAFTRSRP